MDRRDPLGRNGRRGSRSAPYNSDLSPEHVLGTASRSRTAHRRSRTASSHPPGLYQDRLPVRRSPSAPSRPPHLRSDISPYKINRHAPGTATPPGSSTQRYRLAARPGTARSWPGTGGAQATFASSSMAAAAVTCAVNLASGRRGQQRSQMSAAQGVRDDRLLTAPAIQMAGLGSSA